jgi:hypothetical protein
MKMRYWQLPSVGILLSLLAGCAGTTTVQAVAPAHQADLEGIAPETGSYSLYRAVGLDKAGAPVIEKLWTVRVSRGEKMGFRWVTDRTREWSPEGGFRLEAYADHDSRDLGEFKARDVKYVWAAANADIPGYFHGVAQHQFGQTITMQ